MLLKQEETVHLLGTIWSGEFIFAAQVSIWDSRMVYVKLSQNKLQCS